MEVVRAHARLRQHDLVGLPEIQLVFPRFRAGGKDLLPVTRAELPKEGLRHLSPHLVAVLADAGADAGDHIAGVGAELLLHLSQGGSSHPSRRSPPAGVGEADGPPHGIQKIEGHAVCVEGHQGDPRLIRHQPVHIPVVPLPHHALSPVLPPDAAHVGGVGLPGQRHALHLHPQGGGRPPVVLPHRLRGVPPGKGQVHGGVGPAADSPHPGGKSVAHQAGLRQGRKCEKGDAPALRHLHGRSPRFSLPGNLFSLPGKSFHPLLLPLKGVGDPGDLIPQHGHHVKTAGQAAAASPL